MKQYHRYEMNFDSAWVSNASLCMGISLFASALYYLGFTNFKDVPAWELTVCFWLPMILGFTYLVLLRVKQWNAPGAYAILGAVLCVVLLLQSLRSGNIGQIIISLPLYIISAVVLLVVMGGFFPAKLPAMLMFGITIGVRVVVFDLVGLTFAQWITEAATLACLASLLFLPMGTKEIEKKRRERF